MLLIMRRSITVSHCCDIYVPERPKTSSLPQRPKFCHFTVGVNKKQYVCRFHARQFYSLERQDRQFQNFLFVIYRFRICQTWRVLNLLRLFFTIRITSATGTYYTYTQVVPKTIFPFKTEPVVQHRGVQVVWFWAVHLKFNFQFTLLKTKTEYLWLSQKEVRRREIMWTWWRWLKGLK